jgi:hypothetical protein
MTTVWQAPAIQSDFNKRSLRPVSTLLSELEIDLQTRDESAPAEITPALYGELHRIASRHLGCERKNHTLQATALVHEAYLKLNGVRERTFTDEVHFLAVASRVMRPNGEETVWRFRPGIVRRDRAQQGEERRRTGVDRPDSAG